jgi:hypothetical protein
VAAVEIDVIRREFFRLLTEDSETTDARRKEFNQAIFNAEKGWACFNNTSLDMVMDKFEMAVKNICLGRNRR